MPPELIAQQPAEERELSRLLHLGRSTGECAHYQFSELPTLLKSGDLLVFNDSRVVPARLFGVRTSTGGKWEGLFLGAETDGTWRLIGQTRGRLNAGETISIRRDAPRPGAGIMPQPAQNQHLFENGFDLQLLKRNEEGEWIARPSIAGTPWELLDRVGSIPLPPYIDRDADSKTDYERYQTVYARHPGSVAAPTAGLHFSDDLLARLRRQGVQTAFVTLHVGLGTFRPVNVENLDDHQMHAEMAEVSQETVDAIVRTRASGNRVIAVGTTSARSLESASRDGGLQAWTGSTRLFIRPGYQFQSIDGLITNFHLPKSTLLMLVSAFCSWSHMRHAYATAIQERYRFYSYGDAMLIV